MLLELLATLSVGISFSESQLPLTNMSNLPIRLNIYYFTTDQMCSYETQLFSVTHSIDNAVKYSQLIMRKKGDILFMALLVPRLVPGCNIQDQNRANTIYELLQEMQVRIALLFRIARKIHRQPRFLMSLSVHHRWVIANL